MSSISSRWDACTPILETYFAPLLSTLPTTEVNDGRPLAPGGGCVTSAPVSERWVSLLMYHSVSPTHDHCRVCGIGEERYILWFCYDVGPTELHINSDICRVSGIEELIAIHLLQRNVRIILRPCTEALRGLHALCGDACLREDFSSSRRAMTKRQLPRHRQNLCERIMVVKKIQLD